MTRRSRSIGSTLLALAALWSLAACEEGDGLVRVYGGAPPTMSLVAEDSEGSFVESVYVEGEGAEDAGHWEVLLPDGGSIRHSRFQPSTPSQSRFIQFVTLDDVQPGDVIDLERGTAPLPAGCRCQRSSGAGIDLRGVAVYITDEQGNLSASRRYSPGVNRYDEPSSFITCDELDYDDLRERVATLDC